MIITRTKPAAHGFTMLEMVVVIAIIAILVAILLPVLAVARKRGKIAATSAMIANLSLALEHYRDNWGSYPIRFNPSNPHSGNTFDSGNGPDPGYFQSPCVAVGAMLSHLPAAVPTQDDAAYASWPPGENGPLITLLLNTQCLDANKEKLIPDSSTPPQYRMLDYFDSPLIVRFLILPSSGVVQVQQGAGQPWKTIPEKLNQKVYIWSLGYDLKNGVNADVTTNNNYKNLGLPAGWTQGNPCYDLLESQHLENNINNTGDDILSWVQK